MLDDAGPHRSPARQATVAARAASVVTYSPEARACDNTAAVLLSAVTVDVWRRAYGMSTAMPPEVWAQGGFLPDGHTVSISDAYFVAHFLHTVRTHVGVASRCTQNSWPGRTDCKSSKAAINAPSRSAKTKKKKPRG